MSILTEEIKKDITITEDGKVFSSRRGLAYLCGIDPSTLRNLLKTIKGGGTKLSLSLKPYAGSNFEGAGQLPDYLCAAISLTPDNDRVLFVRIRMYFSKTNYGHYTTRISRQQNPST
jgi:hypothetical protein